MIIQKIKLHPFAGFTNRVVNFTSGINIIYGPNEAGKSTLVKALLFAFFEPTNTGTRKPTIELKDALPIGGTDTIAVDIDFECDGIFYQLKKKWGATKYSELTIGADLVITDADKVQEKLALLLKNNKATWENILVANQAALADTITQLINEKSIANSFNDLLRLSVMQQGGVSPDKMLAQVDEIIKKNLEGNWVYDLQGPKTNNGKGNADDKWTNGNGKIIQLFYKIEDLKKNLRLQGEFDQKLDALVAQVDQIQITVAASKNYVESNELIVADVRNRQLLEQQLTNAQTKYDKIKADSTRWNNLNVKEITLANLLPKLETELKELTEEINVATQKAGIVQKKQQLTKIKGLQVELDNLNQTLANTQAIDQQDFDKAFELNSQINRINIQLEAQQLKISLIADKAFNAQITRGIEPPATAIFEKGQIYNWDADSRFVFAGEGFTLEVASGQTDVATLAANYQIAQNKLNALLGRYQALDLVSLQVLHTQYAAQLLAIREKKKELEIVLNGVDLLSLETEISDIEAMPPTRELAHIKEKKEEKQKLSIQSTQQDDQTKIDLDELVVLYQTQDMMDDQLLDCKAEVRNLTSNLATLKALPAGTPSAEVFINAFETRKLSYQNEKEKQNDLQLQIATLKLEALDQTTDDLKEAIQQTQREFTDSLAQTTAYRRIHQKLTNLLSGASLATFSPYYNNTDKYLALLTGNKYSQIKMSDTIPESISDGSKTLVTKLLSQGTKDILALAIRLSMADYFLKEDKGFILMDDPLINLDPERQQFTASCLENYATEKQVLIFTCQPAHVGLFAGNKIDLMSL